MIERDRKQAEYNGVSEYIQTTWTLARLRAIRQQIIELAQAHGAVNVRVYGSVARGEATPESDVDLMVSPLEGVSVFDLVRLWQDLKDLLGCDVSLITDGIEDQTFLRRIQPDLVAL